MRGGRCRVPDCPCEQFRRGDTLAGAADLPVPAFALMMLVALPATWGYEQRQRTHHRQTVACAYRLKDVERRAAMLAAGRPPGTTWVEPAGDPAATIPECKVCAVRLQWLGIAKGEVHGSGDP